MNAIKTVVLNVGKKMVEPKALGTAGALIGMVANGLVGFAQQKTMQDTIAKEVEKQVAKAVAEALKNQ